MISEKQGSMRDAYGEALLELGAENQNIVVLGADTTASLKSATFATKFPERFFNVGIAEQNLIGMAAGMALAGKVVYAGSYAIFVPGKCVDQIRNNVAYPNLNVKIVCSHGGISVGPDGASHQQVEDIAIMRSIPRMNVVVPCDAVSTKAVVKSIAEFAGPFYVRLARPNSPTVYQDGFEYRPGRGAVLQEGSDVAIFACGILVPEALIAARSLKAKQVSASVLDMHSVKPIDEELIEKWATKCGCVVTAEEHNVMGGMGSAVGEVVGERCPVPVNRLGVKDTFGESGEAPDLMKKYGLVAPDIETMALAAIRRKR